MYKLLKTDGRAKRAEMHTVHGVIQTPVFMNVGTVAAIKGAVSTADLNEIGTQVELSNTYHLHVRPGDKLIKELGGLHKFMNWKKRALHLTVILTDIRYSWDRRKACRYSQTLGLQLLWHLMNVLRQKQIKSMYRIR